jgi:hypothetical protein
MKVKVHIGIVLLFVIISMGMMGQTYKNLEIRPHNSVNSNILPLSPFTAQFLDYRKSRRQINSSNVYIRQIGLENMASADIRSVFSNVGFIQQGNKNEAYLQRSAVNLNELIFQQGNGNVLYDVGNTSKRAHQGLFYQRGNNQRLLHLGSNSLSDRIRVYMTGNNQTLIIRNIKRM